MYKNNNKNLKNKKKQKTKTRHLVKVLVIKILSGKIKMQFPLNF